MVFNDASKWEVVFYETARGDAPVEEFLNDLSPSARAKCVAALQALETLGTGLSAPLAKKVADDLWELRPVFAGVQFRFFYAFEAEGLIVVLHAIKKKSRRLAKRDLKTASERLRTFREQAPS
jgi:phage-related protein